MQIPEFIDIELAIAIHDDLEEQAAAYLYHICNNHPFIDGNKRAALGVMEAFLGINGWELNISNQDLEKGCE